MSIFGKPILTGVGKGSASGAVASFSDGAKGLQLRSLVANIEPVQDLHGYDSPWPAGGGINAMPPAVAKSETQNGVTVSTDGSGVYSISGIAEADTIVEFPLINSFVIPDGTPDDGTHSLMLKNTFGSNGVTIYFYNGTTNLDGWIANPINRVSVNYSALANKTCDRIRVKVASGTSITGTFGLMFVPKGTASNTPFSPYSNICPISGWSEVNVWRTGKNLFPDAGDVTVYETHRYKYANPIICKGQTVTISVSSITIGGGYTSSIVFFLRANNVGIVNVSFDTNKNSATWTATEDVYGLNFYATASAATNPGITTIYHDVQLELSSTATAYEPYSGNQYTIQLGQTVYGATLDVTNGVMMVDRAMVDMGTLEYSSGFSGFYTLGIKDDIKVPTTVAQSGLKSDIFIVGNTSNADNMYIQITGAYVGWVVFLPSATYATAADFKTAMNGHQLVYELATPITIPLTATQISTLQGQNNVWADSGDVNVEYLKQTLKYIGSYIH